MAPQNFCYATIVEIYTTGFSDIDWSSDKDKRWSTLGYAFILGDEVFGM